MGSFSTCEISEEIEEQDYADRKIYGVKEGKLPLITEALEDDISKLFKSFNLRNSSRTASSSNQASPCALMKKKPITVPHSPGIGSSRTVSLKQALRDLSLSKASQMAALRRLSKSSSEGTSKAVNIKNLYDTKIAEGSESGSSLREAKEPVLEISVVRGSNSNSSVPNELPRAELMKKDKQVASPLSLSNSFKDRVKNRKAQNEKKTAKHYSTTDRIKDEKSLGSTQVVVKTKELLEQQENIPTSTTSLPGLNAVSESQSNVPVLNKLVSRSKAVSKTGQRSDILGKLPRKTTTTKKKVKQDLVSAASCPDDFVGTVHTDPSVSNLVCKKSPCSLQREPKLKVSSGCSESSKLDVSPESHTNSSSKHSLRDYSSSTTTTTSLSEESNNLSRSSCSNRPHMSKDVRWEAIRYVRRQHGVQCLNLRHFSILTKLGGGDIGTVYLAELIGTNCLFAIKVMDNEYLARREKIQRVQTEREILYVLDHPFLPTLYSHFTSDNLSCLVMEYCPGGDLHVLRQNQLGSRFSEPAARFYVAEVLLALEYLHMLGIIYRDLKPENVLVREDGHIMLTDFDLSLRCMASPTLLQSPRLADPARLSESNPPSCQVPCFTRWSQPQNTVRKVKALKPDRSKFLLPQLVVEPTSARSNSFVGTYEYLAPEIVKGEGHGAAVDWWTFGVFLYELLYGMTPFRGSGNEETLTNVVLRDLQFPNLPRVSSEARDMIGRLLVKDPERRLGAEKGAAEIKQHPFFEGVNWALIRCSIPPQLPEPYEYRVGDVAAAPSKYLEFKGTGEKVEFELF